MQAFEVNDVDGLEQKQPRLGTMRPTPSTGKILLWGLGIATFIIGIGAILGFSIMDYSGSGSNDVCKTEDCIRTSEALRASMNTQTDPCDDFYEFACGNWKSNSSSSVISSVNDKISADLVEILEQIDDNDIDAAQQAKLFYQSCMDFDFSDRDKLEKLKDNNHVFLSIFYPTADNSSSAAKSRDCLYIIYLLDAGHYALMHKYLLRHVEDGTISDTKEQFIKIGESYRNLISRHVWMEKSTKEFLIGKSANMTLHFDHPKWLSSQDAVNACYQGLRHMNGSLLDNTAIVKEWRAKQKQENAGNRPCNFMELRTEKWFPQRVLVESNCLNFNCENEMVVPFLSLLQPPYARNGLKAADYGALGTRMGHGLIDGFGSATIRNVARLDSLWKSETLMAFIDRSICFVKQHANTISSIPDANGMDPYLKMLNKWETPINDIVADNGGLLIAFQAYQLYLSRLGKPELKLPGMEDYTPEQIFFLSYAHILCSSKGFSEDWDPTELEYARLERVGNEYEVAMVLSNSEEFSSAWNCRRTSRMNRDKKCLLWE